MNLYEKTLAGIEACFGREPAFIACGRKCPYRIPGQNIRVCMSILMDDVKDVVHLATLRNVAKPVILADVESAAPGQDFWIEYVKGKIQTGVIAVTKAKIENGFLVVAGCRDFTWKLENYGLFRPMGWRCWTCRPTKNDMKAVKWEE